VGIGAKAILTTVRVIIIVRIVLNILLIIIDYFYIFPTVSWNH
jgi:hypothetical protein